MSQIAADGRDAQTHAIIGAAMRVHGALGHGFLEPVYQAALAVEFQASDIAFRREAPFEIVYRGQRLDAGYRIDFLGFGAVLVQLKALPRLSGREESQVINYLKASGCQRALLLNFGAPSLEYRRLIQTNQNLRPSASSVDESSATRFTTRRLTPWPRRRRALWGGPFRQ